MENEQIEKLIQANPEVLEQFNLLHQDILSELQKRFKRMIADGDIIQRYLLSVALLEILKIQDLVLKEHLNAQARQMGYNIVDGGTTEH